MPDPFLFRALPLAGAIVLSLSVLGLVAAPAASQPPESGDRHARSSLADSVTPVPAGGSVLVLHYHRPDGDYRGWNAWVWSDSGEGIAYPFDTETTFGRAAVVQVDTVPGRFGFIVRRGNWEMKDVDRDRFVANDGDRLVEVWLNAGDATVYTSPDAVDLSPRLMGGFLDAADRLSLASSTPLKSRDLRDAVLRTTAGEVGVRSLRRSPTQTPGMIAYDVQLRSRLTADQLTGPMHFVAPGYDPLQVLARRVLNDRGFTPLDARLGVFATATTTTFTTWSPVAESAELLLYEHGIERSPSRVLKMASGERGLWRLTVAEGLHGTPYQYRFTSYGEARTVADIHAFAALPGSTHTVVVDLARTDPEGWDDHEPPTIDRLTDEVIYEVHVRDWSMTDPHTPSELRGKYPGLVTVGAPSAVGPDGEPLPEALRVSTGLTHLKDLGVTAVHLLPIQDFGNERHEYNWGYWTSLFNVPESDYSTTPNDPAATIRELKQTIKTLHEHDIRVILDVVYNHTSSSGAYSPFEQTVPGFYFRRHPDGSYRNDAGVGNSVADEHAMVRKYIVDSLLYWADEYKVDGFRFDLVGTHRPETVRQIARDLRAARPDITLYGEPWTGGGPIYFGKGEQRGLRFAVFNDHFRNALRGDLDGTATGFANGPGGDLNSLRNGVAGAIDDFTDSPVETINYVSAHDNRTLWDKLEHTLPDADEATKRAMHKLHLGVVLTSQGVPFLHGGVDLARTKGGHHNSYNQGDAVNAFGWDRKAEYFDIHRYVAGLVRLRREHPAFRMTTQAQVRDALRFLDNTPSGVIAYTLDGRAVGDAWGRILVAYNGEPTAHMVSLPSGRWSVVVDDRSAGVDTLRAARRSVELPPYSMVVMHR